MTAVETVTLTKSPVAPGQVEFSTPGFDLTELLNKVGTESATFEPDDRPSLPLVRINLTNHKVGLGSRVAVFRQGPLWNGFSLIAEATYKDQKVFSGKELSELAKTAGLDTKNNPGSILASRIRAKIEERPERPKILIKFGPPHFPHYQLRATVEYTNDSLIIDEHVVSNVSGADREGTNELDKMAISKAKEGDKEAFAELYERYRGRVYRQCFFRVSSPQEAEDLTSEVFLRVLSAITQGRYIDNGRPFVRYLLTITHNLLVDHYRAKKETSSIEDVVIKAGEATDPQVFAERNLLSSKLRLAIAKLTRDQKDVFIARYLEGMEFWQIAEQLHKSEGAIRVKLTRARRRLRADPDLIGLLEKNVA